MNDDMFLEAEIINDLIDEKYNRSTNDKIRAAIKVECDRQHVGEDRQAMLYEAFSKLHKSCDLPLSRVFLSMIAYAVEPSNDGQLRTTPVSFNGIVGGVHPNAIPACMENWVDVFNGEMELIEGGQSDGYGDVYVDQIIKEFLDIHPFSDGNGRTAWLLRVWMLNQWDDPQPLPDYYKEA